jgi:hypothetical protein
MNDDHGKNSLFISSFRPLRDALEAICPTDMAVA